MEGAVTYYLENISDPNYSTDLLLKLYDDLSRCNTEMIVIAAIAHHLDWQNMIQAQNMQRLSRLHKIATSPPTLFALSP